MALLHSASSLNSRSLLTICSKDEKKTINFIPSTPLSCTWNWLLLLLSSHSKSKEDSDIAGSYSVPFSLLADKLDVWEHELLISTLVFNDCIMNVTSSGVNDKSVLMDTWYTQLFHYFHLQRFRYFHLHAVL